MVVVPSRTSSSHRFVAGSFCLFLGDLLGDWITGVGARSTSFLGDLLGDWITGVGARSTSFLSDLLGDWITGVGARSTSLSPKASFAIGRTLPVEGPASSSLSTSEDGDGDLPSSIRGGCCRRRCASGNSNLGGQATSGEKSGCSGGRRELDEGLYLYRGLTISCFCPRLELLVSVVHETD